MAETPEDTNARLFHLTTLSPRARAAISNEMYFIDTDKDSVDILTIQQEAFLCLTEDMSEIGVYWSTSNEDIYESAYTLDQALSVLDYIMPNTLYVKMRNDAALVECLRSLLQGDITDADPIISYIDFLGGSDAQGPYVLDLTAACQFVRENIRSTEVFVDYITSLLSKYDSERVSATLMLTSPKAYHQFITETINRCYDACVAVRRAGLITDEQQDLLNKRINLSHRYFLQSDRIESFSFVTLTNVNDLAPDGQQTYQIYKKEMLAGCRLSLSYRTSRDLPITHIDAIASLLLLYGISGSLTDYKVRVEEEKDLLGDSSLSAVVDTITALYK